MKISYSGVGGSDATASDMLADMLDSIQAAGTNIVLQGEHFE